MSYRQRVIQTDKSFFVNASNDETGGMVVKSRKGSSTPVLCQSERDVLLYFGNPSSTYPNVFEALAFTRIAPCWVTSAIHSDALYGGIDISLSGVTGFGIGRDISTFDFSSYPTLSHVFFASSPYQDDLAVQIAYAGTGKRFKLTLYQVLTTGNSYITEYNYSLDVEKDAFGASLYIFDVFDNNPYLIPKVNTSFVSTGYTVSGVTTYLSGGSRGTDPTTSDYTTAWNNFQYANKYPVKIFMDVEGNSTATINTIIQTYQPYAHGISVIPKGNDAQEAKTYRQSLGLDTSNVSLYTNWARIQDDYNNSSAWISNVGSVGKRFAYMADTYDADSPAGVNENNHGGQLNDWKVIEVENSYSDKDTGSDLQTLDEAQINPIIFDEVYGLMIYGDKTLQVTNSSLSFIGHRRLYNYIINIITKQILRQQEFKLNDPAHRLKATTLINSFMEPIKIAGWLRDYYVDCSKDNNGDDVLNARKFVVDVYVKVTPNSQFVLLNMIYLPQQATIKVNIT